MGAGRTETTRAIFGIDAKESGQIFLDGREVAIHKPRMPYRQESCWPLRTGKRTDYVQN